ncbi:sigma-54-dependent transcriptional regulator [Amaricoccus tamworthensis]|uniref:sigma-54-dependent transcriptional regulator n=1 Tax=Amaricoccus tamworthensis TaxID=57002 RepID=UPI003C7B104D
MSDSLLLVEDTETLSLIYSRTLNRAGHQVDCAYSLQQAHEMISADRPRVVLLDLQLPDGDGIDLLDRLRVEAPDVRAIVITANGSIYRAVQAMRAGAFDFLVKPFDDARLVNAVQNALTSAPAPVVVEEDQEVDAQGFQGFIGSSEAMNGIYRMIRSIGRSTATVFITGESGTGKDVCARAIHSMSTRASKPFVPLNCAAIPRDLLESEVFGHLKGAFTGALSDKPGAAAVADGGTLFLDEICEMDLSLQTKLLRFLQTSTIQPVGASRPRNVDVRIVCATNRDPIKEVKAGRFREDLYYRLHVVPIHMPPLAGRGSDILDIAEACLQEFSAEEHRQFKGFDEEASALLARHPWPGNVRQLLNVIRNVVVLNEGELVTAGMLPPDMFVDLSAATAVPPAPVGRGSVVSNLPGRPPVATGNAMAGLVGRPMAEVERGLIEATIEHCNGSIPQAAKILELSPSTIYRKIEVWNRASAGEERRSVS